MFWGEVNSVKFMAIKSTVIDIRQCFRKNYERLSRETEIYQEFLFAQLIDF